MIRIFLTTGCIALGTAVTCADPASAGPLDRLEDRIDRIESIRDERVNHGPRDRIEDVLDRYESRLDRRGIEYAGPIDRFERRKYRRWLRNHN